MDWCCRPESSYYPHTVRLAIASHEKDQVQLLVNRTFCHHWQWVFSCFTSHIKDALMGRLLTEALIEKFDQICIDSVIRPGSS